MALPKILDRLFTVLSFDFGVFFFSVFHGILIKICQEKVCQETIQVSGDLGLDFLICKMEL